MIKFSSETYGTFGCNFEVKEYVATSHGVALRNLGLVKYKSLRVNFRYWYSFRAEPLGLVAEMAGLDQYRLEKWAESTPNLTCGCLPEILAQAQTFTSDFRRAKRPLVRINTATGPTVAILWEIYTDKVGLYVGTDAFGRGGFVWFVTHDELDRMLIKN